MSDWFEGAGNGRSVDVSALMDSDIPDIMWAVVQAGALVSMALTSDGGALGVTVTWDGKWRREYFRDVDTLRDWIAGAATAVTSLQASRPTPSGAPRSRNGSRAR